MRETLVDAALASTRGNLKRHKANVEVYLTNPVGIGEHSNILEAIETELDAMSKYEERIQILEKYFVKK
tara:strand:- start:9 stop:215 length:207 start_codon:yes stop_codon:yes gene_type:complete